MNAFRRKILLFGFGISGAAALTYEVVWTREISLVLGSTIYAVSTMLTAFMAGLALGSYLGGLAGDRFKNPVLLFSLCEFGVGIFGLLSIPLIKLLPPFYFYLYSNFHLKPEAFFMFQFCLCMLIMLVPTTLMGATFPLASKSLVSDVNELGRQVGGLYSFNTLGAVAGSFTAGFFLVPFFGLNTATIIAGCANVAAGLMITFAAGGGKAAAPMILVCIFAATAYPVSRMERTQGYVYNFYKNGRFRTLAEFAEDARFVELVYYRDDPHGTVKVFHDRALNSYFLENGGKIEGSTTSDIPNELLLTYLPLAARGHAPDFLVVGLGTGMTLKAAKEALGSAECVEINGSVVEAVDKFFFPGLFSRGVTLHLADARNFLALTDKKYDVISSEPSYPTESTAGNLFTLEFFRIAAARLKPGGLYVQWLPYYQLKRDGVTIMVKTFAEVFPHVYIWKVPISADLIMIGSKTPFIMDEAKVREDVAAMNMLPGELPFVLSKTPEQVREIVENTPHLPINRDDKPVVEFLVARNVMSGE